MTPCARIQFIEDNAHKLSAEHVDDVLWLAGQVRSWQWFARNVVAFGELLEAENASPALREGYDAIFKMSYAPHPAR